EERDVLGEVRDLAAVPFLLALVSARRAVRDHAGEVHRHLRWRDGNHFDLDRRIARRHEEADAYRSPARFQGRNYFSMLATLSIPALTQASSFSPPGAPEAPAAPMVSSPTLIGSAPW